MTKLVSMLESLSFEEAHRIFSYDVNTGLLRWKVKVSIRAVVGKVAGTCDEDGRRRVRYLGVKYLTSRVVWLMNTGSWPKHQIDHKNNDPSDDRFENLREASYAGNARNKGVRSDSRIGIKGVIKCRDRYQARIHANKKTVYLGTFDTVEEAGAAYSDACKKFHGEFANDGTLR